MKRENPIADKSLDFAVKIVEFCELLEQKKKFVVAKQLLRSGTSVGSNIRESQSSESRNDFIHKLKIASKEAEETEYWLLLCTRVTSYPNPDETLMELNKEVLKLLNSIIAKAKSNTRQN